MHHEAHFSVPSCGSRGKATARVFLSSSHTALYCLLCKADTPPEGNSSTSDKGNLINNHSRFYFALSLILASLHTFSYLRHGSQNFIKGEMSSGILQEVERNMWNCNKTKYNSQCTSNSVYRKLKQSFPQLQHTEAVKRVKSGLCSLKIITKFTVYLTSRGKRQ